MDDCFTNLKVSRGAEQAGVANMRHSFRGWWFKFGKVVSEKGRFVQTRLLPPLKESRRPYAVQSGEFHSTGSICLTQVHELVGS
jgi:hypothetical protein